MKRLETIELARPYEFKSPFGGADYAVLLVVCDATITDDEQATLSRSIVAQGCRWAVCTGRNASSWDESIDWAYLETAENFEPPDSSFVMTTWHDEETPEEMAQFLVKSTSFDCFESRNLLLLLLGCDRAARVAFEAAVRKELGAGGSPALNRAG